MARHAATGLVAIEELCADIDRKDALLQGCLIAIVEALVRVQKRLVRMLTELEFIFTRKGWANKGCFLLNAGD